MQPRVRWQRNNRTPDYIGPLTGFNDKAGDVDWILCLTLFVCWTRLLESSGSRRATNRRLSNGRDSCDRKWSSCLVDFRLSGSA